MELQNQKKAPIRKARPPSGKVAKGRFHFALPLDLEKNARLVLAALLFVGSTWWALTRFSRPDPFRKPELFSWAWFIHPLEVNAPARLPVVSGTLTSLAIAENGKDLLVAGQQGTVLLYRASSQQWENRSVPDSLGKGMPAPSAYRTERPLLNAPSRWERGEPRIGTGDAYPESKP